MNFLSLDIYSGKYQDFLKKITNPKQKTLVFTPNPEIFLRASRDVDFYTLLAKADYLTPDGNGLYIASMMQEGRGYISACYRLFFHRKKITKKYGELIKGSDLTRDIFEGTQKMKSWKTNIMVIDQRVTLFKSEFDTRKSKIQKQAKTFLEEKYPHTMIHSIFEWDMTPDAIAHYIELQDIRYVFSTLGMKSQEQILVDIWSYLPISQRVVWLGVGSSIDYLLSLQKRAPLIVQNLWLEWLYRLILSPRKRWKRIVDAVWEFPRMIRDKNL